MAERSKRRMSFQKGYSALDNLIFHPLRPIGPRAAGMDLVNPGLVGKRDKHWVESITTELISKCAHPQINKF